MFHFRYHDMSGFRARLPSSKCEQTPHLTRRMCWDDVRALGARTRLGTRLSTTLERSAFLFRSLLKC